MKGERNGRCVKEIGRENKGTREREQLLPANPFGICG